MLERSEAVKIQLAEAHKYVHQFMSMRIAAFGTLVAFVGALVAIVFRAETQPHARFAIWGFTALVLFIATMLLGSIGRAIWLFCAHMMVMERDLYGPGGNHQWLIANLMDRRYSSTFGFFFAISVLGAAVFALFLLDVYHMPLRVGGKWIAAGAAALLMTLMGRLIYRNLHPGQVIPDAIDRAVENEKLIAKLDALPTERFIDEARTEPRIAPYLSLLRRARGEK